MSPDAIVVGGGLIGLATAWRAAQRGCDVTVLDNAPGSGASSVAAGMLAPVTEVTYGEDELLRLAIASSYRWPEFASELEDATGMNIGFRPAGTLLVAYDADDRRVLDKLQTFMRELDLDVEALRSRACRTREPMLSPRIRGGIVAHHDHQVDPRRVLEALSCAATDAGVTFRRAQASRIEHDGDAVTGVTTDSGDRLEAAHTVLAAGVWSGQLQGLPDLVRPPVRPVKGQILRVRSLDKKPILGATVRGIVQGRTVYLVPRDDGTLVIGATQEERGFDTTVTAGGIRELLDDASRIVPGVDQLELVEAEAGLRPGTHDNRPLIGSTFLDGLLLATGHFRNGVLLTPITAEMIAAQLTGEPPDLVAAVADPGRPGVPTQAWSSTTAPGARLGPARTPTGERQFMTIEVNGEARHLNKSLTVGGLVDSEVADRRGVAVAVDGEVIPRVNWDAAAISDGAHIEVIGAVQGG